MSVCHYLIEGFFVDSVKLPSRSVREHDRPYLLSNNLQYQEPKVRGLIIPSLYKIRCGAKRPGLSRDPGEAHN